MIVLSSTNRECKKINISLHISLEKYIILQMIFTLNKLTSMKQIKAQYGFPIFINESSTDYLLKADKNRVSDTWALWHYIIKSQKKRFPGKTNYPFLLSVLEQAQYFYEAASVAPIKSKPLLYYYSFLNIAKAAIVLRNPELLDSTLEFNHGIDSCSITSKAKLEGCYVLIKSLIRTDGQNKKISVAYQLAQLFGDNIEVKTPSPTNHDNGPWKIDIISLLKSCIGIHRTVSETYKSNESFVRLEAPIIEKNGKQLIYKGIVNSTQQERSLLTTAGYTISEINNKWQFEEKYNMPTPNLSRNIFYQFSKQISGKGLWTYTTGDDYKLYINPYRLIKVPQDNVYKFSEFNGATQTFQVTLSSATVIYYLMFFFGSITRYHPYLFEKVLTDKEIWLVSEFLKTQPFQFILLLTSKVLGRPLFTSRMPISQI